MKSKYDMTWQIGCAVLTALGRTQQLTVRYSGELIEKEVRWNKTKLARSVGTTGRRIVRDILNRYKKEE